MEGVPGSFGTSASFALRLGQTLFSSASLLFMCFDDHFYSFTAFCYLVAVMGLVIPWSAGLALLDAYSILITRLTGKTRVVSIIIVGDFVLAFLSLAAASSAASITNILLALGAPACPGHACARYQLSTALAFLSWSLSFASTLFNLWLMPGLLSP